MEIGPEWTEFTPSVKARLGNRNPPGVQLNGNALQMNKNAEDMVNPDRLSVTILLHEKDGCTTTVAIDDSADGTIAIRRRKTGIYIYTGQGFNDAVGTSYGGPYALSRDPDTGYLVFDVPNKRKLWELEEANSPPTAPTE